MLEVRSLNKRYGHLLAVQDVGFRIAPGEVLGYVGPNGAGKSTTVKMIIGLLEPTSGQVLFHGRSVIDDLPAFQSRLGYVPEEPHLYPHLSGREYLQLSGRLYGMRRKLLEPKIGEFLHLFSLSDDQHTPLSAYSKGMRQKILISAALLHNPEVLLFDEPLSGLDVTTSLVFRDLIQQLAALGRIIFYSSHVLEVVEKVCSQVLILCKGKVAAHDTIGNLRALMNQPSLEAVFAELTQERDHAQVAHHILEVMQA